MNSKDFFEGMGIGQENLPEPVRHAAEMCDRFCRPIENADADDIAKLLSSFAQMQSFVAAVFGDHAMLSCLSDMACMIYWMGYARGQGGSIELVVADEPGQEDGK